MQSAVPVGHRGDASQGVPRAELPGAVTMRAVLVLALLLPAAVAAAQDMPPEVKVTAVVEELQPTTTVDLHDIVLTATKSISTVQETPSIVTIITSDDIRRWGFRDLTELLASVPGWFRIGTQGSSAINSQPRGFQPPL